MKRAAAITTWAYVEMFGLPAVPVAKYLNDNGFLPLFRDQFTMYGGPWPDRFGAGYQTDTLVVLLIAFFLVTLVAAAFAWMAGEDHGSAPSQPGLAAGRGRVLVRLRPSLPVADRRAQSSADRRRLEIARHRARHLRGPLSTRPA